MVATNILPAYVLNSYIWQLLQNNTKMVTGDYGGRVPIVPSGDYADLTPYNKPFLVYGFSEDTTADLYARRGGSLSYAVYSTSSAEVANLLNIIKTAMERRDETAREVNDYTSTVPAFAGIRFGSISVGYFEGPSPEETEGGRTNGIIVLRHNYFAEYTVKTFKNGVWA